MARRQRIDTAKGAKEIFEGAMKTIEPPLGIELGDGVYPYWEKLVNAKAGRAWQDQDLLMLVELSRNLYLTEKYSRDLLTEEPTYKSNTGPKANPKINIVDNMVKRARMIMAMLQIHPEATQGKSGVQAKQNKAHAEAKAAIASQSEDDLIAAPHQAH